MAETAKTETKLVIPSWDDGDYYDASFAVSKSRRYHAMMAACYRTCHRVVVASSALTGTSAFVALLSNNPGIAKSLTGVVAVAATFDLVFAFSEQANKQDDMRRRFTELAAKIAEMPPTQENLASVRAERLRIEADDSEEMRLIDLKAQNDECRARGVHPDDLVPLSKWQRWLGYFATFDMQRLRDAADKREKELRLAQTPAQ